MSDTHTDIAMDLPGRINELEKELEGYKKEMRNFAKLAALYKAPVESIPSIPGIEIHGTTIPKYKIGGDHITYVDFNRRYDLTRRIDFAKREGDYAQMHELETNRSRAGILLMDVQGHNDTDALMASIMHHMFLLGIPYELDRHGHITTDLFERMNMRAYESSGISKTVSLIYGEIHSNGKFRFLSAGHPLPLVYSKKHKRFMELKDVNGDNFNHSEVIGLKPSIEHTDIGMHGESPFGFKQPYHTNEISLLGRGDILLLYSDGLSDHSNKKGELFFEGGLEDCIRENHSRPASEIAGCIKESLLSHHPKRHDDISYVVIKKH